MADSGVVVLSSEAAVDFRVALCERLIRDYRGALAARRPEDFLAHIYERAAEELYVLELRVASLRREAVRAAGERGSLPGCAVSRAA